MDRHLVISSDCHAGLPPERYRDYLDERYRAAFDQALPIQLQLTREAAKKFLVADIRIWENKIYRANPVLCDGDRLIGKFRQWTKQFYSQPA